MEETDKPLTFVEVKHPDEATFAESKAMLALAKDWDIETPEMAHAAADDLREVKRLWKELESKRTAITKPLLEAKRQIDELFKPAKGWLKEAERLLKDEILQYQQTEERVARALQREADEEAAKERKRLEAKAKVASATLQKDKAEELREEAAAVVAPAVVSEAPKLAGVSVRKVWKARVTDKEAFIRHVLDERKDLLPLLMVNEGSLSALARTFKDGLNLPGVTVTEESSVAARS